MVSETNKPNGPVAAALLSAGIGSTIFGLSVFFSDLSAGFATAMNWLKPVGPLSGKSSVGVLAFFLAWVILNNLWKGKDIDFDRISKIAVVLLVVGLITTFPPFWGLFHGE